MNYSIDISKLNKRDIYFLSNNAFEKMHGKGWGYSYVYSFTELRDIYLVLKYNKFTTFEDFTNKYVKGYVPFEKTEWNSRRVMEVINALKNFGLIDKAGNIMVSPIFGNTPIGTQLCDSDKNVLIDIFFNYFRFKEFLMLYYNPQFFCENESIRGEVNISSESLIKKSNALLSFSSKGVRTDSFILLDDNVQNIYQIPDEFNGQKNSALKRFWDVFIVWGERLGVLEKFNLKMFSHILKSEKLISCSYVISNAIPYDSLIEIIKKKYPSSRSIRVDDLIFYLCIKYRMSVEMSKQFIISQYYEFNDLISLVRTSEIFIKETEFTDNEKVFLPKFKGSYISHIVIRKQ